MNYGVFKPGVIHSREHKQSHKTKDEPHNTEQKTEYYCVLLLNKVPNQAKCWKDGDYP